MNSLYVGSFDRHTGKTTVAFGLAKLAQSRGMRVGYVKPLGGEPGAPGAGYDRDAVFMAEALNLPEPLEVLSPVMPDPGLLEGALAHGAPELMRRVEEAHRKVAHNRDLVIVGGAGRLWAGRALGLDAPAVVRALASRVMVILTWDQGGVADLALAAADIFRRDLCGVVINRVPPRLVSRVAEVDARALERRNVAVHAVLPADDTLGAVSAGEIARELDGEVLAGQDHLDSLVERVMVGAMNVDSALRLFRRSRNKAVITGGDRADIQIAALETSTRCLVLTGGLYPNEIVLAKAGHARVPVVVVRHDTFSAVEKIEGMAGQLRARETEKLERAWALVAERFNFDRMLSCLLG